MCLLPLGRPRPPRKAPLLCSRGCACGPAAVIGPDDGYGRCSAPPGRECGPHRRASPCSSTCKPHPVLSSPHATPAPPTATICNGPAVHGPAAVRQGCEARPLAIPVVLPVDPTMTVTRPAAPDKDAKLETLGGDFRITPKLSEIFRGVKA